MAQPELEAALRRDPGDESAWTVFGDLLAEAGDSHGELIALEQRAQVSERPFERSLLEHQARELFDRDHRSWLGPLADAGLELTWQRGFVTEVVIGRAHTATLEALLDLPCAALLRRLVVLRPRSLARLAKLLAARADPEHHRPRPIAELVIRNPIISASTSASASTSTSTSAVFQPSSGRSLSPLASLGSLDQLTELNIEGASLTGVAALGRLPQLQTLALRRCEGELDGLQAGFAALRSLELSAHARVEELGAGFAAAGLEPLARLTQLRELDLGDAGWTKVEALAELGALERLDLRSTEVIDLEPLRALESLRELNLSGCTGLSNLAPLAGLTQLERLSLAYTRVRDLRPLAKLERLRVLGLAGAAVTDLSPLFQLPALAKLDLKACEVKELGPLLARGVTVHGFRAPQRSWRDIAEDHLRRR